MVSYEGFKKFDASLQKEYGMKKRIIPKIENTFGVFADWIVSRYPLISGIFICVMSFMLLLMYKAM